VWHLPGPVFAEQKATGAADQVQAGEGVPQQIAVAARAAIE
jgi:hypothetical protein